MKNFINKTKKFIIYVIILILILFSITFLHIFLKSNFNKNENSIVDENIIDYDTMLNELKLLDKNINDSENLSFNENVYKVDFYKNAVSAYNMKLDEIKNKLLKVINDKNVESNLLYDIEKFNEELNNDDIQHKRMYESSILSSINSYKNRLDKTKQKCYKLIEDYKQYLIKK